VGFKTGHYAGHNEHTELYVHYAVPYSLEYSPPSGGASSGGVLQILGRLKRLGLSHCKVQ